MDEQQVLEVSLIENLQRENLNALEEAAAIRTLMDEHDLTQDEVAKRLGKSRPAIANAVRLLSLPEELQAALERAGVSAEDIAGRQLIVVCADGDAGQLLRFEADGQLVWTQVGDAVEARVGQNGVSREKTEGDRKTPQGLFFLGYAFGCEEPPADIAMGFRRVTQDSYWVDDGNSHYYNQWVEGTAYKDWVSAEHLADYPAQYALAVVVQYNNDPPRPGMGSAIFLHCGERPTMGCIAIAHDRMTEVLTWLRPEKLPMILIETGEGQ